MVKKEKLFSKKAGKSSYLNNKISLCHGKDYGHIFTGLIGFMK
jgi:hypothetical protein